GDGGRGTGVVSTLGSLDRETVPVLLVPLLVGDAGSVTTSVTLTIHVDDLNDNPMSPASRHIQANVLQPQVDAVPLGRVYVKDADEEDASSKTYRWMISQHPSFSLDSSTGSLALMPGTRDGRYELAFLVSDVSQGQQDVSANVTVQVKSVQHRDLQEAIPLTLEADPLRVVKEQEPSSVLSQLVGVVRAWVKEREGEEEGREGRGEPVRRKVVREEGRKRKQGDMGERERKRRRLTLEGRREVGTGVGEERRDSVGVDGVGVRVVSVQELETTSSTFLTRVWITSPADANLDLLLLRRFFQLSHAIGVRVVDVGVGVCTEIGLETVERHVSVRNASHSSTTDDRRSSTYSSSAMPSTPVTSQIATPGTSHQPATESTPGPNAEPASTAGTLARYSVVEAGGTAVVGPRVDLINLCSCHRVDKAPERTHHKPCPHHTCNQHTCPQHTCVQHTCRPHTCLNGGRCLPTPTGYNGWSSS
ncbi:hypothetical protein OTU49_009905, partial [Cherax quadricarinatus]